MAKNAISVQNLTKIFKVQQNGSAQPKTVYAINNLSFDIKQGEVVAFIGPNGGGKSTTIKILTSILYPSSGTASVLGLTPWKERNKLCRQIGAVFGQKSQLYYHLPPTDSFHLLAVAYGLSSKEEKERVKELSLQFEIESFLNQPVKNMSLGQRMRCELVASLLHRPKVLFLDEPTIGLDIEAKYLFRSFLKKQALKDGTTIFLTSHDIGDIESLCQRILLINHGKLIINSNLNALKSSYMNKKTIVLTYHNGEKQEIEINSDTPLNMALNQALPNRPIQDISIRETDLEKIISQIYQQKP